MVTTKPNNVTVSGPFEVQKFYTAHRKITFHFSQPSRYHNTGRTIIIKVQ
jgi:hypothetical protein